MPALKRHVINGKDRTNAIQQLQDCLADLIDLSLQGKQAHWNVIGANFRSLHLQLDEIIASARTASDELAERMLTLGSAADGRISTVAEKTRLEPYPEGLKSVAESVSLIADRIATVIEGLRQSIQATEESDLVTQDLLVEHAGILEKHLWMVQAQEG